MASDIKNIFKKVLKEVVPTESEKKKLDAVINFTKTRISKALSEKKVHANVVLGGSVAKGTWLHNNCDVDFFIKFDQKYEKEDIGKLLGKVIKYVFKGIKTVHGTRDYYQVNIKGYNLEIVPVLAVKHPKDAKNSMDASPFHVKYIKEKIEAHPGIANEIRLLKTFAYAQNTYGAETFISGFSGYVIELLMVHYGSFSKLVESWDNIKPKIYIDIEKHFENLSEAEKLLSKSKTSSPIILIDPVLKERNACAALDERTFARMLFAIRMFKRKPIIDFFKQKKVKTKTRGTVIATYKLDKSMLENDVYMAKVKSALASAVRRLERSKILVYGYGFTDSTAFIEIETLKLSKYRKHKGPAVWINPDFFDKFVKKWKSSYVQGTDIVVDVKREFSDIKSYALKIIKEEMKNV